MFSRTLIFSMQLFVAAVFYVFFMSLTTPARSEPELIPVDSPFETQFTNPPTTGTGNLRPGDMMAQWKRKWEDFNLHRWLSPQQREQLDFFRLRASELPTFLSVRTLPPSAWKKSANRILRNGELISAELMNVQNDYLVVEVLEGY